MNQTIDVITIGNAIVDVLSYEDDAFLEKHGLVKGSMALIDPEQAETLYSDMGTAVEISGGSASNTAAGFASFGGKGRYIGKVCDDQFGALFAHDIRAIGVTFDTPAIQGFPPTARSFIIVTPDAQRTMNTYLGACVELGPDDIDPDTIAEAQITYMEGYLWDKPTAKDAFIKAAEAAHAAGKQVSLTLSDTFCVERHRESFLDLVTNHIDIIFANEAEALALYETDDLASALDRFREHCGITAVTRSEKGSIIATATDRIEIDAVPPSRLVDTTGAGDLYASGFLYGLSTKRPLAECGQLASLAASEIISHLGPRP
ncbi:MAG: adenosine kinase, partial [Pseudomonadota bacterium]